MGMGRGAGNLKLEDFLKYKNKITDKKKIDRFGKVFMYPLHSKYKWGKISIMNILLNITFIPLLYKGF